jgi:hypothetical protein
VVLFVAASGACGPTISGTADEAASGSTTSSTSDGPDSTSDGSDSTSDSETGEPLPECTWEPVSEECVTETGPLMPGPVGNYTLVTAQPSVAAGADGSIHILLKAEQEGGTSVVSHFTNASGTWTEETFANCCHSFEAELQISDTNVLAATVGQYLRSDSDGFHNLGPLYDDPGARELVIAWENDLAYFLADDLESSSYSIWAHDGACLTRRWTTSGCGLAPAYMRLALSPNGDRLVALAEGGDQLLFKDFNKPAPEFVPVGTGPIEVLGDADMDATGRVHVCFWRSKEIGIIWASGFGPDDWQEIRLPATFSDVTSGFRCRLAVHPDGSDIWFTNPVGSLRIEHMQGDMSIPEQIGPFAPPGLGGALWDVTLGPDEQPVVVAHRSSPDWNDDVWFVARRIGDGVWESEVFAEIPNQP